MNNKKINPEFLDKNGKLLPEVDKFNWGACIFGCIWGIFNNSYLTFIGLIALIPTMPTMLLGLILPIWFGMKGNKWALENKKWKSVEHFNHVQKLWAIWALVISFVIMVPLIIGYALLIVWIVNNPEKSQEIINQVIIMTK